MMKPAVLITLGIVVTWLSAFAGAAEPAGPVFYRGADLSMLPVLEKAGAIFRDGEKPTDLPALLAAKGCNLVRLRLFVDPGKDYAKTYGAVQDLDDMIEMAR